MPQHWRATLRQHSLHILFSLLDVFSRPTSPTLVAIDLRAHEITTLHLQQEPLCPTTPTAPDSITHVVCSARVCGLCGDPSSIVAQESPSTKPNLVDGGANICITGELGLLLKVVDIPPSKIAVALHSGP